MPSSGHSTASTNAGSLVLFLSAKKAVNDRISACNVAFWHFATHSNVLNLRPIWRQTGNEWMCGLG